MKKKLSPYNRLNFKRDKWTPAEDMQKQFASVLTALEKYKPKKPKYIDKKSKL